MDAYIRRAGMVWNNLAFTTLTHQSTVCSFSYFTAAFCCMGTLPVVVVMVTFVLWLVVCYVLSQRLSFFAYINDASFF